MNRLLRAVWLVTIALLVASGTGCGRKPTTISHSGIGVPWTVGPEGVLPGTDVETPGVDCGTVSMEEFTFGTGKTVSVVIWSDLPSGIGSGFGRMHRGKSVTSASHIAPDDREIRFRCETTDDLGVSVSIAGHQYDASKGTLFLVSTQGDEPHVVQRQLSFDLGQFRNLLQELSDAQSVSGAFESRREAAENIKAFALESDQVSGFFVQPTQQDGAQ